MFRDTAYIELRYGVCRIKKNKTLTYLQNNIGFSIYVVFIGQTAIF